MKMEERGDFPEKKFKRHGIGGKRFFRKNFFRNFKILCDLSCASRRLGLGVVPPHPTQNGKFAANKAIQTAQTAQTVEVYATHK